MIVNCRSNRRFELIRPLLSALVLAVLCQPARGAMFYSFNSTLPAGQVLQLSVGAGSKTTLPVYLIFTGTDAAQVNGAAGGKGLFSADVELVRQGTIPPNPADPVGILSSADVVPGSLFDGFTNVSRISAADVDVFQSVAPTATLGAPGSPAGSDVQTMLLGQATVTASAVIGAIATFRAQDLPGFDDTVTFSDTQGVVLDSMIAPADVRFTIVPEPATAALLLCVLLWNLSSTRPRRHSNRQIL